MPKHRFSGYVYVGHIYEIGKIKQEMDENLRNLPLESVCKVFLNFFYKKKEYCFSSSEYGIACIA